MRTDPLSTLRLTLRRLRAEDAPALHENCSSDRETARYLERSACTNPEATRALVERWIGMYETEDFYLWAIEYEGAVIGTINLHDICREKASCEIGFSIGSHWWNRGIMTEAAGAVLKHAFHSLGFRRIAGWCAAENIGSARVMEKIGMKKEGCALQPVCLSGGRTTNPIRYAIAIDIPAEAGCISGEMK